MCLFLNFLKVVITNPNTFVVALIQLPKSGSGLIYGDSLHNPYPAHLEAVLGQ